MRIILFLTLFVFRLVNCQSDTSATYSCKDIKKTSTILRLKQYLFCDYDQDVRPIDQNKNVTNVIFSLLPQSFEIDDSTNAMTLHTWMTLLWRDPHLTWEPANYDNIRWFSVKSYEVWQPDVIIHNAGDANIDIDMPHTSCWLLYKGDIYCVPTILLNTICHADHSSWPYDRMYCTFRFTSWSYSREELPITFTTRTYEEDLLIAGYEKSLEWNIDRFYVTQQTAFSKFGENFKTNMGSYHFVLTRHASRHTAVYMMPAFVLTVLTLTTLWLEPRSIERVALANISFICHLLCVHDIHWKIADDGLSPPKLLAFYGNSFILATISLILTSVLRHVQNINVGAPVWVSSRTAAILRSKIGQILLISILDPKASAKIEVQADDNTVLVPSEKKDMAWEYLVILIGWITFFLAAITYTIMFAMLIPTGPPPQSDSITSH